MMALIKTLTDFGDLAVLLPLVAVVTIWLATLRRPLTLIWWFVAVALCIASTAILKIYFFVCPSMASLHSPSGHTSLGTVVYGALTLAIATSFSGARRVAILVAGAAFIVGIGISRILIQAHSIPEVVLGSIIGITALAVFVGEFWRHRPSQLHLRGLLIASTVLMFLLNGQDLRAEEMLHAIGIYLNNAGLRCF